MAESSISKGRKSAINVPRYQIDLDAPAETRWNEVIDKHKEDLRAAQYILEHDEMMGALKLAKTVLGWFKSRVFYINELRAIAKRAEIDLDGLVLLQLVYEACAHCTSVVVNDSDHDLPVHIRTMDWELNILKPLTIEIEFMRSGRVIALATTWIGYLGILTGMNVNDSDPFSVSVNFRISGDSFVKNLKGAIKGSWPIGFLLREVLTEEDTNYQKARNYLTNSDLIAPVYFTMAGSQHNQGCIITRDRKGEINPVDLDDTNLTIVQTNCDHWEENPEFDIMYSVDRRRAVKAFIRGGGVRNPDNLWNLMSLSPIFSDITIYATIMIPSQRVYETRLPTSRGSDAFGLKSEKTIIKELDIHTCRQCGQDVAGQLNAPGGCLHEGEWHSTFGDCSLLSCAKGLGVKRIGRQHWSCCYRTDPNDMRCPKSSAHVFD